MKKEKETTKKGQCNGLKLSLHNIKSTVIKENVDKAKATKRLLQRN